MMTNSIRFSFGVGIVAGVAALYVTRRRRNRSLLLRARRRAGTLLKGRASRLISHFAAACIAKGREEAARQKRGLIEAMEAGKTAYQKVAG